MTPGRGGPPLTDLQRQRLISPARRTTPAATAAVASSAASPPAIRGRGGAGASGAGGRGGYAGAPPRGPHLKPLQKRPSEERPSEGSTRSGSGRGAAAEDAKSPIGGVAVGRSVTFGEGRNSRDSSADSGGDSREASRGRSRKSRSGRRRSAGDHGWEHESPSVVDDSADPLKPAIGIFGEQGRTQRRRSLFLFTSLPNAGTQGDVVDPAAKNCSTPQREEANAPATRKNSNLSTVSESGCCRRVASLAGPVAILPSAVSAAPETEGELAFRNALKEAGDCLGTGISAPYASFSSVTTGRTGRGHQDSRSDVSGSMHSTQVGSTRRGSRDVSDSNPESSWRRKKTTPQVADGGAFGGFVQAEGGDSEDNSVDSSDESSAEKPKEKLNMTRPKFAMPQPDDDDPDEEVRVAAQNEKPDVNLGEMRLSVVPDSLFSTCAHVVALDLIGNNLTELPEAIGTLSCLERLSLKSNKIAVLPDALGNCSALTHLYADQNELVGVPASLSKLTSLQAVGLDWNDIREFPVSLLSSPVLAKLYLCENPELKEIPPPAAFAALTSGLELYVDNSPGLVKSSKGLVAGGKVELVWNKIFPDEIIPGVYLGSLRSAQELRVYQTLGIGFVASIGRELSVVLGQGMEQMQLNVDDLVDTDLSALFEQVHDFIDEALKAGKGVLVHCFKGQSRSATMVMTYLMKKRRITRDDALAFVREHRPMVNPNPGFMRLMANYEVTIGIAPPSTPA
eukprot:Hpha_TRINITY_DN13916_c1_g1::TRINITY_DN13916_c1_g1_i1::g.35897::m.35897